MTYHLSNMVLPLPINIVSVKFQEPGLWRTSRQASSHADGKPATQPQRVPSPQPHRITSAPLFSHTYPTKLPNQQQTSLIYTTHLPSAWAISAASSRKTTLMVRVEHWALRRRQRRKHPYRAMSRAHRNAQLEGHHGH